MLDLSKPIQTRDGKPARVIATDLKGTDNIIALIDYGETESIGVRLRDGRSNTEEEMASDLINVPPERTERFFFIYTSAEEAHMVERPARDAAVLLETLSNDRPVVKVVFEDGEYVGAELVDGKGAL
jgi:hypothetical protein